MDTTAWRAPVKGNEGQTTRLAQVKSPKAGGQIWKSLIWTLEVYPDHSHQGVLFCRWSESSLVNSQDRGGPQEHCAQQETLFLLSQVQDMVLGL